ncbi:MAG TPA: histidine kinase [Chitinophagaceae bacterium]|nr:histidine kinase [Chitinophagaceae bacterium]
MKFFWKYKLDHVLFWTVTIIFHAFLKLFLLSKAGTGDWVLEIIVRNVLLAFICYLNIYYLFPRFFKRKQYWLYAAGIFLSLLFYVLAKNAHDIWLYGYVLHDLSKRNFFFNTYYNFSVAAFYLVFTITLVLSRQWYLQQQLLQQVQMEKLQTELQYLKSQMNPHFLFNSINTIFFQIDKTNTGARESLQKFSSLLRYQLYECNADTIAIEKETEYLKNYVALQQLRKNENYSIRFCVGENVEGFSIAPLLLIPFVENAFKFISSYSDKPNCVEIKMNRGGDMFLFHVSNTKEESHDIHTNGGIGLKNVRRRLELLYKDKYELNIVDGEGIFTVNLQLQLP